MPVTFFTGRTFDGHPWVLSFEGGPTATDPATPCRVSGRVGPSLKIRKLGARAGSELRAMLPGLELAEVSDVAWELALEERRAR